MKTYMASPSDIERKWYVVDATGYTLGRLASEVAKVLRGKNKPIFTPHMDCGDYVIVVNAEKIGKSRIIVTELPYAVNKARLIEKIAELVKDKKVDGITDLRDESNREGLRICIELRRDVNANVIMNRLLKHTQLQDTFGVIMLALVNNEPKVMNLH